MAASPAGAQDAASFAARAGPWSRGLVAAKALEAPLVLRFGKRPALAGRLLVPHRPECLASRLKDATLAVFDGKSARVSPATSGFEQARFHLLTWPYFAALPMKLRDSGTRLQAEGEHTRRSA